MSRRFLIAVTVAFCLLCSVPYALAAARTPAGARFSGTLLNHFDQNYYRAAQRSAARELSPANRFTTEADAPGPGPQLYPVLGHVQRLTGLPGGLLYHLPRLAAMVAFPALLAYLFRLCFPGRGQQAGWSVVLALLATGLLTLAPGLGLAERSGERIPESNILYSFTVFPHFAVSWVGLVLSFTALAKAVRGHSMAGVVLTAGSAGVLLALGHTFLLLPLAVVLAASLLAVAFRAAAGRASWTGFGRLLAVGVVALPAAPVAYRLQGAQERLEELQGFAFPTARPDAWWTWAMGFGVVTLLALPGGVALFRSHRRDALVWLLPGWAAVQVACIYLPLTVFQRRMSEGLIVPVAGLAGWGVGLVGGPSRTALATRGVLAGILVIGALAVVDTLGVSGEYLPTDLFAVASMVNGDDVVLAGHTVSSVLPAISDATAFVARPVETLHYEAKLTAAAGYARDPTSAASLRWLRSEGITIVATSRGDRSFEPRRLDEPAAACMDRVYDGPSITAYRVRATCPAAAR